MHAADLQRKVTLPVGMGVLGLLVCLLAAIHVHMGSMEHHLTAAYAKNAQSLWEQSLRENALQLEGLAQDILADPAMEKALRQRDTQALLAIAQPLYARLHARFGVTHWYFITPDRRILLRIHAPEKSGDEVRRRTLLEAEKTGKPSTGLELGPLATFTQRHVAPWHAGGERIGYVELGTEVDHIAGRITKTLSIETLVAVHKKFTTEKFFSEGKRRFKFPGEWNDHPGFAVLGQTIAPFPESLSSPWQAYVDELDFGIARIRTAGKTWSSTFLPLQDMEGETVASMALLRDIRGELSERGKVLALAAGFSLLAGMALAGLLAQRMRLIGNQLADARLSDRFTKEGVEIKYAITQTIQQIDIPFPERMKKALDALTSMQDSRGNGGAKLLLEKEEGPTCSVAHGEPLWAASTPEGLPGKGVQVVRHCALRSPDHGHYFIPLAQDGEPLGTLIVDTVPNPSEHPARLDALKSIGETLARAIVNERIFHLMREVAAQAEAASLSKSRFLATMSHELRTPMNGILGMAQVLLAHPDIDGHEREKHLRTIIDSGNALLALLGDILDLSNMEAGNVELARVPFSPALLMENTRALFIEAAKKKGLHLDVQWNGPPADSYLGDPQRLQQMLSNLAGNAVKFTRNGEIRIEGREDQRTGNEATLSFLVTDTGIGIPEDHQESIFRPFSQIDGSTTRQHGGAGVGLSIVRSLARAMGGEVSVESAPGKGASFRVRVNVNININIGQ